MGNFKRFLRQNISAIKSHRSFLSETQKLMIHYAIRYVYTFGNSEWKDHFHETNHQSNSVFYKTFISTWCRTGIEAPERKESFCEKEEEKYLLDILLDSIEKNTNFLHHSTYILVWTHLLLLRGCALFRLLHHSMCFLTAAKNI